MTTFDIDPEDIPTGSGLGPSDKDITTLWKGYKRHSTKGMFGVECLAGTARARAAAVGSAQLARDRSIDRPLALSSSGIPGPAVMVESFNSHRRVHVVNHYEDNEYGEDGRPSARPEDTGERL